MEHWITLNLRLFEGEGGMARGGGGGTAPDGATAGGTEGTQDSMMADSGDGQEPGQEGGNTPEERIEEYNRLKADFKDLYGEDMKKASSRGYKEAEQLRRQLDEYGPLISTLSAKYGLEDPDIKTVVEAINNDNSFWEEAATKEGMSVEQYKKMKQYEAEHRQLVESAKRAEQIRQRDQTWARWNQEAGQCAQKFPQFSMEAELNNPDFVRLLGAGLDVESAYKAAHFDELTRGIAEHTKEETRKRVADSIRAGSGRPIENGLGSGTAGKPRTSAWDLSAEEFARILERAKSGEVIQTFEP